MNGGRTNRGIFPADLVYPGSSKAANGFPARLPLANARRWGQCLLKVHPGEPSGEKDRNNLWNPMPKRISEIADSLRQLGEIQVNEWDLMGLLNKDLKDLEIGRSLRRLGNAKVMEWDFRTALPAVHKLAHQEVDLAGWVRRAAHYKVMEWDFRSVLQDSVDPAPAPVRQVPEPQEMQELIVRLRSFLHFLAMNLIDEPELAQIRIQEIEPGVVRFKLVVTKKDLMTILGRDGSTASAIRNLLKASAQASGAHALLEIVPDDEESPRQA
jgi:predicted RNA-binding protein YlqC (UPF0109 family)